MAKSQAAHTAEPRASSRKLFEDEPVCGWTLEQSARDRGALRIAGVDEVGRGPIFGPVVAAAVILAPNCRLPGLDDSKKLSEKKRLELEPLIRENAIAWSIAEVDAATIDRINIRQASLLAMRKAVSQLALSPDYLLIDGLDTIDWPCPQQAVVKGDSASYSIAAASILAKCFRDRMVIELDARYPGYGLAQHKGYGSALHLEALTRLGPTPLHRKSFNPVAQTVLAFDGAPAAPDLFHAAPQEEPPTATPEAAAEEPAKSASTATATPRLPCPCCGYLTLSAPGAYQHCELCWWEDDPNQFADPGYANGANAPCLTEARRNFRQIGVSDPQFKGQARKPRPEEIPSQPSLLV